jgi:hypothetical protein
MISLQSTFKEFASYRESLFVQISSVYSIPCSNVFTEDVFNHMKHAWTPNRNSVLVETVDAELQIRLSCRMKCNEFFSFVQNEPELIKCARRTEKYNYTKKPYST